ncbi:MAG: ribonucleoside triphosphate reductase, partial [Stutzerimonas stutzeri]
MTDVQYFEGPETRQLPKSVVKRDGSLKPFNHGKILSAILRAGQATGEFSAAAARDVTAQVLRIIAHRYPHRAPTIENVQDIVEQQLIAAGYLVTARAYIVYREQHQKLREDRRTL